MTFSVDVSMYRSTPNEIVTDPARRAAFASLEERVSRGGDPRRVLPGVPPHARGRQGDSPPRAPGRIETLAERLRSEWRGGHASFRGFWTVVFPHRHI